MILSKFYKIFFIVLLMVGGFLLTSGVRIASASCVDDCAGDPACEMGCTGATTGAGTTGGATTGGATTGAGSSVTMPNLLDPSITSVQLLFGAIVDDLITPLALLFAGVMIIWSGFLFVTAQGDPAAISKAKQNFIWTVVGVAIVLASKAIVDYVTGLLGTGATGTGTALVTTITNLFKNQIIPFMFVLVTVYFCWGIVTYVRAGGDQKAIDTGKQHMIWGIIGMAIMASAWGIVEMIRVSIL